MELNHNEKLDREVIEKQRKGFDEIKMYGSGNVKEESWRGRGKGENG